MNALFRETADVSVRPAVPGDEEHIARIQLASWRATHAETLAGALDLLDPAAFESGWAEAIGAPPGAAHRVLVACAGPRVVGFVAVRPTADDGGEIVALEVDPPEQRSGHGSRLLAAAVDSLRTDGAGAVTAWVMQGDAGREQFFRSSGLGPDGRSRDLATGARTVTEYRWAAEI